MTPKTQRVILTTALALGGTIALGLYGVMLYIAIHWNPAWQ